ncbi:hypothetical protein MKSMC1_61370 [Mycobacterium kansasii]|uniref:Uncharacterized protein n=1 Tax=Mycobacterium kansasii ATCC 12478 TaxID=557599 RepID=U5WY58_MYCKA|nr:hypothetical protein MKAN_10365 [Mycobacterium kansasii ATCC 12478]KEP38723.1 hypothetical protein MKSMC1_61370 [Mycobacterium kansasii]
MCRVPVRFDDFVVVGAAIAPCKQSLNQVGVIVGYQRLG